MLEGCRYSEFVYPRRQIIGKKNHSTQKQKYHCVETAAAPQRGNHLKSRRAAYVAACLLMVDGNSSGFSGHSTFLSKDLPHSVCVIHTNQQSVKYFLCTSCTFFYECRGHTGLYSWVTLVYTLYKVCLSKRRKIFFESLYINLKKCVMS